MQLNTISILGKVNPNLKKFQREATRVAKTNFLSKKEKLKENFESHEVTRELAAGPLNDDNPTGLLGGRSGNIWAFLGLNASYNPIQHLWAILDQGTRIFTLPTNKKQRNLITYSFKISAPTMQEFYEQTPMPWSSKSWVRAIENGLSGLSYYLFKEGLGPWSRSGQAIQAKNWATKKLQLVKAEPSSMKGRKYVSELLEKFRAYFR